MIHDPLLVSAAIACMAGIAVLRVAWSRPRRSAAFNGAGWGLLLTGQVLGWASGGAWGASIAALWAMAAAFVALAWAAFASKPGKAPASNRRVGMLPEAGEPLRLAGRLLTFVLVVLVCAVLALGMALAACKATEWAGLSRADAYATGFFVFPLGWTLVAYAVLMQPARRGQFKVLALASLPTWPVLAAPLLAAGALS